jgi:hypothetical protein
MNSVHELIGLFQSEVTSNQANAKSRFNQTKHLSKGYSLIDPAVYNKALAAWHREIRKGGRHDLSTIGFNPDLIEKIQIFKDLTNKNALQELVPEDTSHRMQTNSALTIRDKYLIRDSDHKRQMLFLDFEKIIVAQAELKSIALHLASLFYGQISVPPGAFGGLKSFDGAVHKMTMRPGKRESNFADLKDVARMTVVFPNIDNMNNASTVVEGSEEFKPLKHLQHMLKNRFSFVEGDNTKIGPTDVGYRDIKFFLQFKNNIVGELQLNTENMVTAKHKAHAIYNLTRYVPPQTTGSVPINDKHIIEKAVKDFNPAWFKFVSERIRDNGRLNLIKKMIERMAENPTPVFMVTGEEVLALKEVSVLIYTEIGDANKAI